MYFKIFLILSSLFGCSLSKTIGDDKGFNPQPCNKTNHGKIKLFKDRQSNDKLLFCTDDEGFYSWKAVDGSQSRGEFFDPAYDCSDVLNNVDDAKDGFYWINFGIANKPRKVWCDMTTDGGGYMLIGRKRNASMWSVPSNDETVTPFGSPHWTSAFGHAPILDFRVQMATKESFSDTKAHWSFRLKAKRLLKNLLEIGQGGCDRRSAGIGNIAYVKDLQTESIVTTNFQCSKFGFAHQPSLKFGWSMMNSCLQKPCSNGFAFLDHPNIKWQTDTSGAFSYSVTGNVSGIHDDSTAFVGCDNKCCACYGPLGGTGNYCGDDCQAKPGGTITKNVYTWFWVRSALPKRVWKKCMEYQVTADNGDVVWHKLKDGNGVPKKGRCSKNELLLNDGIVVVPDSAAAKKVPSVPGLLEYREDNKKLYVRANKTWNVVAEEDKVLEKILKMVEPKLNQFEKKLKNQNQKVNAKLSEIETRLGIQLNQTIENIINTMSEIKICGTAKADCHKFTTCSDTGRGRFECTCNKGYSGDGKTCTAKCEKMDIIFLVDRSGSIRPSDYDHMRAFLKVIGKRLKIGERDDEGNIIGQGAIVTFSEKGEKQITLKESQTSGKFEYVVDEMPDPLPGGRTKTHRGLALADKEVAIKEAGLRVDDPTVEKIFMVITDGEQTRERGYTYVGDAMKPFFKRNMTVFAVGVGLTKTRAIDQVKDMVEIPENAIFTENFKQLTETADNFIKKFCQNDSLSVILLGKPKFRQQIEQWLPVRTPWHLCYCATIYGWAASTFHSRCDNKGATVTIVRVGQYIFGGYNDLSWTGSGGHKSSRNAFLFSLRNKDNLKPFKAPVYRYSQDAIHDSSSYGPIFGGGHDLLIANNAHSSTDSSTNFGNTYQPPSGYSYRSGNTRALLAGSYHFTPSEVEVFYFR